MVATAERMLRGTVLGMTLGILLGGPWTLAGSVHPVTAGTDGDDEAGEAGEGEDKKEKGSGALHAWGTLKAQKAAGEFSFTYRKVVEKRARSETVTVKVPQDVETFRDQSIRIEDLKVGERVWLLGHAVEREAPTRQGLATGTDRQIQNTSVIAAGESVEVNRGYRDPRDPNSSWLEGVVETAGGSIWVKHQEERYKVVMSKSFAVLRRSKVEKPAALKGTVAAAVLAKAEEPAAEPARGDSKPTFTAERIVLLERRLLTSVYPRLLE